MFELAENPFKVPSSVQYKACHEGITAQRAKSLWEVVDWFRNRSYAHAAVMLVSELKVQEIERPK